METREYQEAIKEDVCKWCGYRGLSKLPVDMYPHENGWTVAGELERQWLSVRCPKCDYDWSLWKLGVPREAGTF